MSKIQQTIIGTILLSDSLKFQKSYSDLLIPEFFSGINADIIKIIKEQNNNNQIADVALFFQSKLDNYILTCISYTSLTNNKQELLFQLREEYFASECLKLKNAGTLDLASTIIDSAKEKAQILEEMKPNTIQSVISNSLEVLNHDITNLDKTGFADVDTKFVGFLPGQVCTVGGYSGVGKSTLLFSLLKNIAFKNETLVFNLEMDNYTMSSRILSSLSGVPFLWCQSIGNSKVLEEIKKNNMSERLSMAMKKIDEMKLKMVDDQFTMEKIVGTIRKEAENNNLKYVFIDYLQLIHTMGNKQRHVEIGEITRQLKLLAKELKITLIVLAQLSRATLTREEPEIQDLRESGSIEMDSDLIFLIWRKKSGESFIRLAKDRMFGKCFIAELNYNLKTQSYD